MAIAQPKTDESRVLRISRRLRAPRGRVFRALTEPDRVVRWWGPKGFTVPEYTIDLRVGGAWRSVMRSPEGNDHIVSGVYRTITPPELLEFTWAWETEGPRGHETLVRIELHDAGGETDLKLVQEIFESANARDLHGQGWTSALEGLADALDSGVLD